MANDERRDRGAERQPASPPEASSTGEDALPMWERPEVVARFAARPPDRRLQALFAGEGTLAPVRAAWMPTSRRPAVLDVGCAGGRNSVWLVEHGADVHAVDASAAMVVATRERLARSLGADEAERRVQRRGMRDLRCFPDGAFDLVLALGVLQDAGDRREFDDALDEVARVLRVDGLCLVANFGPDSRPDGAPLRAVAGKRDVWTGFGAGERRMTLPDRAGLDAAFLERALRPAVATERVRVETPRGYRTTLNALYRKGDGPPSRRDAARPH